MAAAPAVAADPAPPRAVTGLGTDSARRDVAGRTGISPSWEAIKRGDDAYIARNLDGAIHEYQAAIEARPQNPIGHYRLACAQIAKGDFTSAQHSLDDALRFSKADSITTGKILFVMADLKERQQDYPAALTAWKAYSAFAASHAETKTFAASSDSRQARLTAYSKLAEQSAQVKQRIAERLQAAELQNPPDARSPKPADPKR
jgi:tetratricopeptide (TPR) repeat protein